jgi:hypothetical protein
MADWLYSVWQSVALYCADHATWGTHTLEYLRRYAAISDKSLPSFATIDTLCEALEYYLGYEGNFSLRSRGGKYWDVEVLKKFRYERPVGVLRM